MGKFMKPGKVVMVLAGRYAGRKAVIVKNIDDGTTDRPYSHALVAGIDRYPRKVTTTMGKKKIAKRSKIKAFVKVFNYNHLMPTRYSVDIPLDKTVVNKDVFRDPALKRKARREAKVKFEERVVQMITVTMSSDEEFSLVTEPPNELGAIKDLIDSYKKKHEELIQEQKELTVRKEDAQDMRQKCKERTEKLIQALKNDQLDHEQKVESEKARLDLLKEEEFQLMKEFQKVQDALKEEQAKNKHLKQQTGVFSAVPERDVVFTGLTGKAGNNQSFEMESSINYPMDEGTRPWSHSRRKKILNMKTHRVDLGGECSITVGARPVQLMLPRLVEIDTEVCPQRILISNLPRIDTEILLNKLEIHFSKKKHGGGEVEDCDMLSDSGTVVLTFVEQDIAKGLTDTEYHEVKLQNNKLHRVKVTPFLNGKVTNFKTKMSVCPRTVLLTEIPDIMDRETLQDVLEIHFQKTSNGGGEIEAFLYTLYNHAGSAHHGAV
ncbi:hypothetical protein L3Q82_014023 [Scortum barcoo]|uniref:Uncharacterized protein n=1 Tax=Scortum barcoo TaxID=214431 RepID=A0ACB8VYN1_9TELE|nr:hypothetical protein L3Q82_014023 [Scortum barcoo]